jgi:hypothetical protein
MLTPEDMGATTDRVRHEDSVDVDQLRVAFLTTPHPIVRNATWVLIQVDSDHVGL